MPTILDAATMIADAYNAKTDANGIPMERGEGMQGIIKVAPFMYWANTPAASPASLISWLPSLLPSCFICSNTVRLSASTCGLVNKLNMVSGSLFTQTNASESALVLMCKAATL